MQEALADLSEASQKNFAIVTQKNPSYKTIQESDQQAFESYDILLTRSSLINAFNTIFYYFKFLISFYDNPANAIVIKKTTNIIEVLLQLKTQLTEVLQWISRAQECNQTDLKIIENYLRYHGFNIVELGNKIQNETNDHQRQKKKNAESKDRYKKFNQQQQNHNH